MNGSQPDLDLEQLISEFQRSGVRELHIRKDGIEVYLSQDADAQGLDAPTVQVRGEASLAAPAQTAATDDTAAAQAQSKPIDLPVGAVIVPAPYLGTFYRSPKPGQAPYVEIGQTVDIDTELCLVEVMKLFTAVRAGTAGTIHAILVGDGQMVAAEQPLFVILPA